MSAVHYIAIAVALALVLFITVVVMALRSRRNDEPWLDCAETECKPWGEQQ